MRKHLKNLKPFLDKYERVLSAAALFIGFLVDSLTLQRIDLFFENAILITYLLVAGFSIIVLNFRTSRMEEGTPRSWIVAIVPFVMQIAFGALFSAFVIFYFRSASLSASWLFMLFLLAMLLGNEAFRPYYERLTFHVSVFFFAVLSYCIFAVPVLVHKIGPLVFLGSVVASVVCVIPFLFLLSLVARQSFERSLPSIARSITAILAAVMFAYLTNIIPPVPLSLKDAVIAHDAVRNSGTYLLSAEPQSLFEQLLPTKTYHQFANEPVYVWVSVFAPTDLSTAIVHEWEEKRGGKWITANRVTFPITGGRDEGFRGYSVKENLTPGAWRVSVETARGQVIGRVRFDVISVPSEPVVELVQK